MEIKKIGLVIAVLLNSFVFTHAENWSDSIQAYMTQARALNAEAYMKLAVCYHEGKGVEHNLPMVLAMLKGAEKYGEGLSIEKFFASLDAGDADRKTYEGLMKLEESGIEDFDVVMATAKRGGELMEKMIQVTWLQRSGKVREAVMLMTELAERIPACYTTLGDYYKERDRVKALEYYRLADKWACLNSAGAELLLEEEYKKEQLTHQSNKHEQNRLRLIKDGIGG